MLIISLCMQLLQSLKSKMLDLARALQSYMYHHITVSIFLFLDLCFKTVPCMTSPVCVWLQCRSGQSHAPLLL